MAAVESVRLVGMGTKRDLMTLLYKVIEPERIKDYASLHVVVKKVQSMLEKNYGVTLGYKFQDGEKSIHPVWDEELQEDVEIYDALGGVVNNDEQRGFNVSSRRKGTYLLKTDIKDNLNQQFGDIGALEDAMRLAYLS